MSFAYLQAAQYAGGLKSPAKFLLWALANYADEQGSCYPSYQTLAYDTELSEKTIQRHMEALEALGLVTRYRPKNPDGPRAGYRYRLNLDAMRRQRQERPKRSSAPKPIEIIEPVNLTADNGQSLPQAPKPIEIIEPVNLTAGGPAVNQGEAQAIDFNGSAKSTSGQSGCEPAVTLTAHKPHRNHQGGGSSSSARARLEPASIPLFGDHLQEGDDGTGWARNDEPSATASPSSGPSGVNAAIRAWNEFAGKHGLRTHDGSAAIDGRLADRLREAGTVEAFTSVIAKIADVPRFLGANGGQPTTLKQILDPSTFRKLAAGEYAGWGRPKPKPDASPPSTPRGDVRAILDAAPAPARPHLEALVSSQHAGATAVVSWFAKDVTWSADGRTLFAARPFTRAQIEERFGRVLAKRGVRIALETHKPMAKAA
ncbi:MAG: helix-turn-helix domain-containing protein [Maricaulaceae bacterium]